MANNDRESGAPQPPRLGERGLFPRLLAKAYVNHAAISALSAPAAAAMARWSEDFQARGAGAFGAWAEQRDQLRTQLAALIGAHANGIALLSNTMHGVNAIAFGFPWQRGDRVVVLDGEYPTNVVPWLRAAETFALVPIHVPVRDFAQPSDQWASLERALHDRPRVLAVSAVQFQTGLRMPLAEIARRCHAVGTQLFVDAVQACGATPIDVSADGIDYLACGSHKWLMGAEGAGFLYVNPARMGELRPTLTGAMSYQDAFDLLSKGAGHLRYDRTLRKDVRVFEGGMVGGASCAALGASVASIATLGVKQIFDHVQRYHDALEPALVERGFVSLRHVDHAQRSCILSFTPPPAVFAPHLCALLAENGVVCSSPDGVLRFSPHWPNALTEVPLVIDAIDAALARLPE